MVAAMEKKEGYIPWKIIKLGKAKSVELRDMVQQPIAGKNIYLQSEEKSFDLKTRQDGTLPDMYPGLFTESINFFFGKPTHGGEKIGAVSPVDFSSDLSFVAPYFLLSSRVREHEVKAPEQPLIHIVKAKETLSGIASANGVSPDALAKANNLTDANKIFERQHLRIPPRSGTTALPQIIPSASKTHPPANTGGATIGGNTDNPTKPAQVKETGSSSSPLAYPTAAVAADHQRTNNKHPVTILSSSTLEPSGSKWCKRFLGSNSLDSLNSDFKPKAKAFIGALEATGIKVAVRAAYRPIERSYLMYHAFEICRGMDVTKIPPFIGIGIDWAHRDTDGKPDPAAARAAAEDMCKGYAIKPHSSAQKVGKPKKSRHNFAAAVDMNIDGYIGKTVKDGAVKEIKIKDFAVLQDIGESYGVIYFSQEKMHWSDTGN
jgi:LysM repeat protein